MQVYKNKDPYIQSTRFEIIKPTFNDSSQLVFHIPEDKRCLRIDEVHLSFSIQIPNCFLPDNNITSKLFNSLDLTINHELISSRGGPLDYSQCSDLMARMMNYSSENLKAQGSLDGSWSFKNGSFDTNEIIKEIHEERFRTATLTSQLTETLTASTDPNYIASNLAMYNFYFYSKIKTPLAYQETPLPSSCSYIFRFGRAQANLGLMKLPYATFNKIDNRFTEEQFNLISNIQDAFEFLPVPLVQPELHVAFSNDPILTRRSHTTSNIRIPFSDFSMRRYILGKGIGEFDIRLAELEKCPEQILFALSDPDREKGKDDQSPCKFSRNGLESFDLKLSGTSLPAFPISYTPNYGQSFYLHFLQACNHFQNPYVSGMNQKDYLDRNFVIMEDLSKYGFKDGTLTARLQFEEPLANNLVLLALPIVAKELNFGENLRLVFKLTSLKI